MLRGFRFTVEKGVIHLSIHLCIKRSQYVKLVYKMIIHNKEQWKHHHQQGKIPTHKSVTCKITSVHKYLLWMSSCVSTYSKWMSRQICIQIKLQERWEAIVAGFALLAGAESQLEVYYDFPTLSPSATPCFWLKCENSSWLITCIFWECRRTTQVRHVAEVTELSNTFSDLESWNYIKITLHISKAFNLTVII